MLAEHSSGSEIPLAGSHVPGWQIGEKIFMARIIREDDKVYIEGVPRWTPREMTTSTMAAYATAMRAIGEDVSYAHLMGASGSAFRLQVAPNLCPSSPNSSCGFKTVAGALAALPYAVEGYSVASDDTPGVERLRAAVRASIDRGLPCVYGSEEDGVIVGYQKGGTEWLCVHPWHEGDGYFVEETWPFGVGVLAHRKAPQPDRRACVLNSLKLALQLAHTREADGYHCGLRAWEHWIGLLDASAGLTGANENALLTATMGNSWIYLCLVDARRAAAEYLTSEENLFGKSAGAHFINAARHYRTMVDDVLGRRPPHEVAPGPEQIKRGQPWTDELRRAQAEVLREALALEQRALEEIDRALATSAKN
jgi:hypothetical protein